MRLHLAGVLAGALIGLQGATQFVAWSFMDAPALGPRIRLAEAAAIYPPWAVLGWRARFGARQPRLFSAATAIVLLAVAAGLGLGDASAPAMRIRRVRGWGALPDARRAGLLADSGCALGRLSGRTLMTTDLRPTLVTGGTRSGKGRGHVIPSLLSWTESVLVHDPKTELWRVTAGWRSRFSYVLRFNPRDPRAARWNPLAEIEPGPGELAQVQRLVAILSDPAGVRDDEAIWDKSASEILEAVILHVLYTAPDTEKSLVTVRALLADLDGTADTMLKTLHRTGAGGAPETHRFIRAAVQGYAAMHDRFRTSVQGTARAYLKWLAGEDIERTLGASDLALGDLMCAEAPVSLYVQVAPADAQTLRPLVRLLFHAAAQALTAREDVDASGRPKRRRLLMAMDEFPLLGRIEFFEKSLRLMSGYGLKPLLVAQSLNDIVETYGPNNTILDNCFVYTAFSALDPLTQEKVSRLTGTVTELRTSRSGPAGFGAGRSSVSRAETERPLLEPGEVRALPSHEQLIFTAGFRPLRTEKLNYDRVEPFRRRARTPPPDPADDLDAPPGRPHPWAGRRALGEDRTLGLPLFKEAAAAIDDKKSAARAAEIYERVAAELAAQEAALDHLQGRHHD